MPSEQPNEAVLSANAQHALRDRQVVEVWLQGLLHVGHLMQYRIAEVKHYDDEHVTTIHAEIELPFRAAPIDIILTVD